jgi:hypothetical protein
MLRIYEGTKIIEIFNLGKITKMCDPRIRIETKMIGEKTS